MVAAPPASDPTTGGRTAIPGMGADTAGAGASGPANGVLDLAGALEAALAITPGRIVSAKEKDKHDVITAWEIEVFTQGESVVEFEVDTAGNEVPGERKPPESKEKITAAMAVVKIEAADAITTALATRPGVVEKVELSTHKGYATWKVEIEDATGDDETIKVDAGTGKVLPD